MKSRKLSALLNTPREAANQFPLLRRFSIASLAAMLVTTAILVFLYRQDQFAEHEEVAVQNNEKIVMQLMRLLGDQINTLITTSNGFDAPALQTNPNIDLFTAALERVRDHDMLKLKIYNLSGTTIYSSARGEIGATSKHLDMLAKALSGKMARRLDFRDTFSSATDEMHDVYISAIYMPLAHEGKRIGVIEVYADATPFFKRLHATLFQIFLIVLGVFAVLYAALFLFLLRADRAIAEGQKTIAQLQLQQEQILNSAGVGLHGIDLQGNIVFENPAAVAMLRWSAQGLVGHHAHSMMHHTRADGSPYTSSECPIYATLHDGTTHSVEDEVFWRKDGTSFPVAYVCTPMKNEAGELVGAIVSFHDITERKLMEKNTAEQLDELRRWYAATSGREGRLLELKHEVNELLGKSGLPPRYPSAESQDQTEK